jgi:hypothetical protein
MLRSNEYVRKVFLHAWKEAINKPPSKTKHLNNKKPDTIKTAMFHKTALIIIAFFAISSLLSLHPSPYDLFSNPITCSILYLCLYISLPSSHSLIASFLSSALTPCHIPSLTFTYISHPILFASLKISMLLPYNPSPTYFTLSPIFSLCPLSHDKNIFLSSSIRTFYPHSQNHPLTFPLPQNKNDLAMCLHLLHHSPTIPPNQAI